MTDLAQVLPATLQGSILWLPLTLALYAGASALYRRCDKAAVLNPTLLTIAGVVLILAAGGIPYDRYFDAVGILHYLLGTAVVALAVPLHRNLKRLEGRCLPMLGALLAGSLASILVGLAVAVVAGASASTILSIAPKSATAAGSMESSRLIGGAA